MPDRIRMPRCKARTLFVAMLLLGCICGCGERAPKLVPVSLAQPLMTYQNSSPRFRLEVFMYAEGNLLFRAENLLEGFHLRELPDVTSETGRILQARRTDENTIEFNLLLPGEAYTQSPADVTIPWVLEEKGADAFLRSMGKIVVDVAMSRTAKYVVKSVEYVPATDMPQSKGEKL
jgi:hypothetical protein